MGRLTKNGDATVEDRIDALKAAAAVEEILSVGPTKIIADTEGNTLVLQAYASNERPSENTPGYETTFSATVRYVFDMSTKGGISVNASSAREATIFGDAYLRREEVEVNIFSGCTLNAILHQARQDRKTLALAYAH